MPGTIEAQVNGLLEQLHARGRRSEDALCNLTRLGVAAIPFVDAAYDREPSSGRRIAIVRALSEFRNSVALPTLARALRASDERVWKTALDAIVALGGLSALEVLESAREEIAAIDEDAERSRWIEEALQQVTKAVMRADFLQRDARLAEVVRRLIAVYHPLRIYLFGSAARGDAARTATMT